MAKKKLTDYKFDEHNFNLHTEEGMQLLDKSIEQFGFGRSVLADKNGVMIGGNGVMETAIKQGKTKVIEVETDGTELVVVKRKDIDINTEQGRAMAYADNVIPSKNLEWNKEELKEAEEKMLISLEEWGGFDFEGLEEEEKEKRKAKATEELSRLKFQDIYYIPKVQPQLKLTDCLNLQKYNEKIKAIDESKLPEKIKATLRIFAYRFIKIDFESVANYYAFNASKEEQEIIERLRLVLVDGGVNGYINDDLLKVANEIVEMTDEDDEE